MPEPIITEIVHSRDSAMFVWSYGGQKNYTLRAKTKRNGIDNTYSGGRCLFEKWPLEGGVPRPPEFYSRDIREGDAGLNMVEVCFARSGEKLKDARYETVPSYVERMSLDLPNVTVIGYSRRRVDAFPDALARALYDGDVSGLGELEASNPSIIRYRNGVPLRGASSDAREFQPYHVRVAEARARSARAGTLSMPSGAPHASGARVGGLDAGAEHVGEEALDKWLRDLGIFS
ncbi:hypothetical protein EV666_101424 [Camelimonas lactis]|uniref:Uncharacterized protein n=2 Tax=Camelimonas lactis TaxID=659006 RepID=A0A4R2GY23_9HYPH|nr:hypothetical protein EV666_101424 [Camelimonas lactis]